VQTWPQRIYALERTRGSNTAIDRQNELYGWAKAFSIRILGKTNQRERMWKEAECRDNQCFER
jgi:hypothetical protein